MKKFLFLVNLLVPLSGFSMTALPDKPEFPADNKQSVDKIKLGKILFFEPRLSKNGTVSCNTCHNVMLGGDDQRSVSVGINGQKGGRSAPTVWNAAFHTVQFWDGRAKSLEEQAVGPITNPIEMGMPNFDIVIERLNKIPGYVTMFDKVFGKNSISKENIGKAVASFERTLIAGNSAFDKYSHGNKNAMTAQAKRGMKLVQDIGCVACHSGSNFNGDKLKMGEGNFQKFPVMTENDFVKKYNLTQDTGRFNVTKKEDDKNIWRVPTWRNVALTAPYFHNGSVKTLDEAVRVMAKVQLDTVLKDDQVNDIVAFLESLTGEFPKIDMPTLPATSKTMLVDLE
jgi:cytochrome c peroxidase